MTQQNVDEIIKLCSEKDAELEAEQMAIVSQILYNSSNNLCMTVLITQEVLMLLTITVIVNSLRLML